ncbi:hypothetical protein LCGC14_0386360 [marine sediment metagenome]|uniref:Transposase n=1 Tax=marine sediment metagenome TaxID=412755 RepID=A0A0F9TJ28_9ZZZZ
MTTSTLARCERCGGNLYPYEGGMKCLQCSRSFGGKEPESRVAPKHYTRGFKEMVVKQALRVGNYALVGRQLGVSDKLVQHWVAGRHDGKR